MRKWFDPGIIISVLLTFPIFTPMLEKGMPHTHDGPFQIFQLLELEKAFRAGILYPRWASDIALGYGAPLFDFYPPLSRYVMLALKLSGFGYTSAIKYAIALSVILSAVTMYLFVKDYWGKHAGVLSAAVYSYFPYHFVNVYVRGAASEEWAFTFFPLLLWSIHRIQRELSARNIALGAIAAAGLILSHHGMAVLFVPVAGAYAAFILLSGPLSSRKVVFVKACRIGLPVALGVGLSAFFWLPFLAESKYVQLGLLSSHVPYMDHFVYPFQLFSSFWGHGGSEVGPDDGMSFQIGLVPLSLAVAGTLSVLILNSSKGDRLRVLFFLAIAILATLMTLEISAPIWNLFRFLASLPFPWRFLAIVSFAMSVPAAALAIRDHFSQQTLTYLTGFLVIVIVLYSYRFVDVEPKQIYDQYINLAQLAMAERSTGNVAFTAASEHLPLWATKPEDSPMYESFLRNKTPIKVRSVSPNGATANALQHSAFSDEFGVNFPSAGKLEINTYYFPGWKAEIDGKPYDPDPSEFLTVNVPAGNHIIRVFFTDTPIVRIANALSLLSLLVFLYLLLPATLKSAIRIRISTRNHYTTTSPGRKNL